MRRIFTVATAVVTLAAGCTSSRVASPDHHPPRPHRIVSLSAVATEMLFAIGAGPQVVAVDDQSDYPANVPRTKLSGFHPNVEAIAAYRPDLVVLSSDTKGVGDGLKQLGIAYVVDPAARRLTDAYGQLTTLGARTGHASGAARVIAKMKSGLAKVVAKVKKRATPLTFYHELDPTSYTATSATFIGQIYAMAGLKNIADPADADGSHGGYPQLSAEFVVRADPDLVFLADGTCCQQDATTFAARPGFAALRAVREHHVVVIDDSIASRWGPRIVDFLAAVVAATASLPDPVPGSAPDR